MFPTAHLFSHYGIDLTLPADPATLVSPTVRAIADFYYLDDDNAAGKPRHRGQHAFTVNRSDAALFEQNGSFLQGTDEFQTISIEPLDTDLAIVRANRRRPATP